ncbi:MAG: hypothetical protein ACK4ZC_03295 [Bacteroidota bacterium]|jgi:hypothetical protein
MQENIIGGLISDFISLILTIGIGWTIYFFTERRKLLGFFNIKDTKRLVIYLGNLRIIQGGSLGTDNLPRGYTGTTIVYSEQVTATKYKERFNFLVPSISERPTFLSKILFSDIKVTSLPSPLTENEIEANCSIISFGSPGYNKVSEVIENYSETRVRFINDNSAIQPDNIPPLNDTLNGFIQRLVITNDGSTRSIFYVAGLSEHGTIGAANYLIDNWKELRKKYGDNTSFNIVVRFPTANFDNYTIVSERAI